MADFNAGFHSGFQERLIDLKNDSSLKLSFAELLLPKFWCQVPNKYPIFYKEGLEIIPFFSSYLYEMGFSILAFMTDKLKKCLHAEHPMRFGVE